MLLYCAKSMCPQGCSVVLRGTPTVGIQNLAKVRKRVGLLRKAVVRGTLPHGDLGTCEPEAADEGGQRAP